MEKHTCKLCSRTFANGRALGGHMRSHVANTTKVAATAISVVKDSSFESSSSSGYINDADAESKATIAMILRENPKKSFRFVDPEFFPFPAIAATATTAGVQDRESETESSLPLPITLRRRSKRARNAKSQPDPTLIQEPEPLSSVSYTTTEEYVAISLMMLSRDFWPDCVTKYDENQSEDETKVSRKQRSKYQCGTCKKVFRSYQALGGHRASHKKTNGCVPPQSVKLADRVGIEEVNVNRILHVCPVCYRVFSSGQALGGHKRSHLANSSNATITISSTAPVASFVGLDLNLPAPMEDDAEVSAVSDAEFVATRA